MNERGFEELLHQILDEFADEHPSQELGYADDEYQIARTETFEEAGVLTRNRGLIVGMRDGAEFQVTVVRSS